MKVNQSTPIAINKLFIPFLGIIEAGFATPVDESLANILKLEEYLIRDIDASFMLRVEDDSLDHIGICENDMIIFERGADIKIGDLIVIMTSDGYRITHASRLLNDRVVGLVISVMRKYK